MVIFVGDCPSKLNKDPNIAFVGSKSEKPLREWIKRLKVKDVELLNSHTDFLMLCIEVESNLGAAVVALGNNASKRLAKSGIPHFKLPHPSPRNRLNNDQNFIDGELKKCKNYLKGLGKCV